MQRRRCEKDGGNGGDHFGTVFEWFWVQFCFWENMIEFWWILGVVFRCFG